MPSTAPSVLVVEDDHELRDLLIRGLRAAGLGATGFATGGDLLRSLDRREPDLVVLDVGLPDADGRDVCLAARARGSLFPVIFLTARDAVVDLISGFEAGGDDYLTKPFAMAELVVRVQALLRRANGTEARLEERFVLDPARHGIEADGRFRSLTPTEFRILAALLARRGEVVQRDRLVAAGWPPGALVSDNALDAFVARVRRKLRGLPGAPVLVTVHGVGYRVEP